MNKLVFIGFGEAAYHIAKGLVREGVTNIIAYDISINCQERGRYIKNRANEIGVTLTENIEEAIDNAEFILSLTSSNVAYNIATQIIPYLTKGQTYIDMNSASPETKQKISRICREDGVKVCDVAIMGTVPEDGHKVSMIVSGDGSEKFYKKFSKYGMNISILDDVAGNASAIKMIRSVVMKGIPQLLFESFEAAEKFGVLDYLIESLNASLYGKTIDTLASNFINRTVVNSKRRAHELDDVILTLDSIGVDSSMSKAIYKKLENLSVMEISQDFVRDDILDKDYRDIIRLIMNENITNNNKV